MSEVPSHTARSVARDDRQQGQPSRGTLRPDNLRFRLLRTAVLAVVAIGLIGAAATAYQLVLPTGSPSTVAAALVAGILCVAVVLIAAAVAARTVRARVAELRLATLQHYHEIQRFAEQLRRGVRAYPHTPASPTLDGDMFHLLAQDIDRLRYASMLAMLEAPVLAPSASPEHRVGVFVNLARRLQSLVHREIQLLDDLEAQVEDPDLLKGLFSVDHLATRIRRHAENLAVLGGAISRRQWSRPVNLYEVLRSAVAEVERYSRVKLVRPIEGTLQGHAVADIIHLVAELVENATMFSNPQTHVLLRAQRVTAGLAIEVEDRGLGMPREEQHRINSMLTAPDQVDVDELLHDGRIGLFVVSALARRHGIAVQLQTNIYGGTQAVIVLPLGLLGASPASHQLEQPAPVPQPPMPVPVVTQPSPVQALPSSPAPIPVPRPANLPLAGQGYSGQPVTTIARPSPDRPPVEQRSPSTGATSAALVRDPRPQLPHRRRQAHLTTQLRDARAGTGESADGPEPGLMSAFQHGFERAGTNTDEAGT